MIDTAHRNLPAVSWPERVARCASRSGKWQTMLVLAAALCTTPVAAMASDGAGNDGAGATLQPYRVGVFLFSESPPEEYREAAKWLDDLNERLQKYRGPQRKKLKNFDGIEITRIDAGRFACATGSQFWESGNVFDPSFDLEEAAEPRSAQADWAAALRQGLTTYTLQAATFDHLKAGYTFVQCGSDGGAPLRSDIEAHGSTHYPGEEDHFFDAYYLLLLRKTTASSDLAYDWEIQSRVIWITRADGETKVETGLHAEFTMQIVPENPKNGKLRVTRSNKEGVEELHRDALIVEEVGSFIKSVPYFAQMAIIEISRSWHSLAGEPVDPSLVHVLCATIEPRNTEIDDEVLVLLVDRNDLNSRIGLKAIEAQLLRGISRQIAEAIDKREIPRRDGQPKRRFDPSTFETSIECDEERFESSEELQAMIDGADYLLDFEYQPKTGGGVSVKLVLRKPQHLAYNDRRYEVDGPGRTLSSKDETLEAIANELKQAAMTNLDGLVEKIETTKGKEVGAAKEEKDQ